MCGRGQLFYYMTWRIHFQLTLDLIMVKTQGSTAELETYCVAATGEVAL